MSLDMDQVRAAAELDMRLMQDCKDVRELRLAYAAMAGRVYGVANEVDRANARADATRQMANTANAALRAKLLAALGIEDDDRTSLAGYVDALIADRDAARAAGRKQAADAIRAEIVAGKPIPWRKAGAVPIASAIADWAARIAEGSDRA